MEHMRRYRLGAATVTLVNLGDLQTSLAGWFGAPRGSAAARYARDFAAPVHLPIVCAHIAIGSRSLLVDAGLYDDIPHSEYAMPGTYQPPPPLVEQLARIDVRPEEITDVAITHRHFDHLSATTYRDGSGEYVPRFPRAHHYLGRADFDDPEVQSALLEPASLAGHTIGVLQRHRLLSLVDGEFALDGAISIIPAPGETPGHQIVRLRSEGQTLYLLGDLIHHPIEIEQPDVMVDWAQREATIASRRALAAAATAEGALLTATHIREVGRLRATPDGVAWETAELPS